MLNLFFKDCIVVIKVKTADIAVIVEIMNNVTIYPYAMVEFTCNIMVENNKAKDKLP